MRQILNLGGMAVTVALLTILSLFPPAVAAQDQSQPVVRHGIRLDDLLAEVRASNPSLRATRLEADALAQKRRQVSALPDPTVMFTYQPYPLLTARGTQRTQWRLQQMIPFPGKLGLKGDISDLSSEIAGLSADAFEDNVDLRVKKAFYELYRIQRQKALVADFQTRLQNFEEVAATQYEVGVGMQQAVLKAQLERNMLTRVDLDLEERLRTAAAQLSDLLNRPVRVDQLGELTVEPPEYRALQGDALFAIAWAERPEVDLLDAAARRADTQIALARKRFYPDFGINLTYFDVGAADVPPTANGKDALGVGVSIKIPLQRGRLHGGLEEARVRREQVEAQQEALETSFRAGIGDLVSRLRQEQQQLALFRQALIPQAETTLEATLSAYTTGRTDFLNLLDAERVLFTLNSGYEDTFARYLKTTAELERALGVSTLAELNQ